MKRKAVFGLFLMLLLIGVLSSVFNIQPAEAAISPNSPAEGIYIVPDQRIFTTSTYCTYLGTLFTIEVIMENFTGVAGFYIRIDYNSTLLNMTSWTFDTGTPMTPTQVAPASVDRIDTDASVPGSVQVATVWTGGISPYTYSGNATAAEITFEIIYCPPHGPSPFYPPNTVSTPLSFYSNTRAVDINGDSILFSIFGDGYYEYTTLSPYALLHVLVEADPNTVNSGGSSTITMRVMNGPNPVPNRDVILFSDQGGTLSPSSGKTDSNGFFNSTFTAPSVTEKTTCTITAAAVYPEFGVENQTQVTVKLLQAVGGIYVPTNTLELLAPYFGLTMLLAVAIATVVYVKKRKKQ